jgi:hypothetical protein
VIRYDFDQRSEEWFRRRLGIPTSSEFDKIVTAAKWELSKQSVGYMLRLLAEWMLDAPLDGPETQWMTRGTALEAQAYRSYEFETDTETEAVGLITTDDGMVACSPDRLITGKPWGLELKAPSAPVHVGYMLDRSVDAAYLPQVQGQLLIGELERVDIQSYFPGLPTVIIPVYRDEEKIKALKRALDAFVETMLACRAKISQEWGQFPRPKPVAGGEDKFDGLGITDSDVEEIIARCHSSARRG